MGNKKKNLENIYDVINKIAKAHKDKGEDVSSWFYKNSEIEELKKNPKNEFI